MNAPGTMTSFLRMVALQRLADLRTLTADECYELFSLEADWLDADTMRNARNEVAA